MNSAISKPSNPMNPNHDQTLRPVVRKRIVTLPAIVMWPRPVTRVSEPAVSPTSKSAGPGTILGVLQARKLAIRQTWKSALRSRCQAPLGTATARLAFALALALWLGALPGLLAQAVPDKINYQGILLKGDGTPVPAVPTDIEFRIYGTAQGSDLLWGWTHRVTPDTNGTFNVVLSEGGARLENTPDVTLASVFTGTGSDSRYLELTVAGSTAIKPRQRFVAAPYAFLAHDVTAAHQDFSVNGTLTVGAAVNAASFAGSGAGLTGISTNNLVQQVVEALCPPGTIVAFAGASIPPGWLLCDGANVSRGQFRRLYDAIGTAWGNRTGGATNFDLPDLRGMFLRGVSGARSDRFADPEGGSREAANSGGNSANNVGTVQTNKPATHTHIWGQTTTGSDTQRTLQSWPSSTASSAVTILEPFYPNVAAEDTAITVAVWDWSLKVTTPSQTLFSKPDSLVWTSGESRPNNASVNYIIKY